MFRDGDRVQVVQVPSRETFYQGLVGSLGRVDGELSQDPDGTIWYHVVLDGEDFASEFKANELAYANERIEAEGILACGDGGCSQLPTLDVGAHGLWEHLCDLNGKRVRVTVEVLDNKEGE